MEAAALRPRLSSCAILVPPAPRGSVKASWAGNTRSRNRADGRTPAAGTARIYCPCCNANRAGVERVFSQLEPPR